MKVRMKKAGSGLEENSCHRRDKRRTRMMVKLGADPENWYDWNWQVANVLREAGQISSLVRLADEEQQAIEAACRNKLPFGITPHYLSLMDDEPRHGRDRAIRAQVFPPLSYVEKMAEAKSKGVCLDFMLESDTSPVNLITRRYPGICIFKPFNTCPQICVYCQRNWEIEDAMQPGAMAPEADIEMALKWIRSHPSIHEVLITGGDPLAMSDLQIERIIDGVAAIPSVERIRIGSRTLVTLPMRITDRAYIMNEGQILVSGSALELSENPEARRIYLGQNFSL